MAYLIKDDYTRLISLVHLNEVIEQAAETSGVSPDQIFTNAFNMAKAEVLAYLNKLFDMTVEFAKNNPDPTRNENVIRAIIHISLFNLHFTVNPHDVPEMRRKAYEALTGSKGELAAVRDGMLDWLLVPKPEEETEGMNRTEIHSGAKFVSKPFTDPYLQQ